MTIPRQQVVEHARSWLGTKWLHQGRNSAGIDCAGVIVCVGRALGLVINDNTAYQRRTSGREFLQAFRDNLCAKPLAAITEGDVLTFAEPIYPCHSGIVTKRHGELYFIHAYAKRRKVVEERLDSDWRAKLVAVFTYPGVI